MQYCILFASLKATTFDEKQRSLIKDLSSKDVPIEERRVWYNALSRRMANPKGLKPGLVEKYVAAAGCNKKRFELLRAFMLDEDMFLGLYILTPP